MTTLERATARIFKVVPELRGVCGNHDYHHGDCFNCLANMRKASLADVMRTIAESNADSVHLFLIDELGGFRRDSGHMQIWWDFTRSFEDQRPEVHEFVELATRA